MDLLNNKSIGRTLKERRLQLGYTQELAAEKSGISYSYYTKIERGEQLPSIEICVHAIVKCYCITFSKKFELTENAYSVNVFMLVCVLLYVKTLNFIIRQLNL